MDVMTILRGGVWCPPRLVSGGAPHGVYAKSRDQVRVDIARWRQIESSMHRLRFESVSIMTLHSRQIARVNAYVRVNELG